MPGKYKVDKGQLRHLFAVIDIELKNHYHDVYKSLGLVQPGGGSSNWPCCQPESHGGGSDNHPSMSISNETGQLFCHTCHYASNLPKFWKEYIAGGPQDTSEGSFTSFMIDYLNLNRFITFGEKTAQDEKNEMQMKEMYNKLNDIQIKETGKQLKENDKKVTRQIKELGKQIGGLGRKFGSFTEGLALPSMQKILQNLISIMLILQMKIDTNQRINTLRLEAGITFKN